MKVLTAYRLKKLGACGAALRTFQRVFGKQARITAANLTKAGMAGLSVQWLAEKLRLVPVHEYIDGVCSACEAERKAGVDRKGSRSISRRALLRSARG